MNNANAGLPDLLVPGLAVVFCGLNPGLESALEHKPFFNRSNRFWRTLFLSGFTAEEIDPDDYVRILQFGCGMTTAVQRATPSAQDVSADEYRRAAQALEAKIVQCSPKYIAFLGKSAYAAITAQRNIAWGLQPDTFGGARVWVLPNPSGRNRSFTLNHLVEAYQLLRLATLEN
ncbi:G/U mismatch-specific DNA glycosylase [Pseudomonas sivasensis]|uniref:G/U mismatch-specific DNA glycosylase n=1 Tax=Pseudomonas sivasensis TaxID=1880678 RepID=UPI0021A9E3BA|nr:G/U mismatch-specific DNA glycosylase [Pseudomonas sivasensis]MCT4498005.1 G/U mismatch-specific DNA glycosylase [Pseudomonas sivasensis]